MAEATQQKSEWKDCKWQKSRTLQFPLGIAAETGLEQLL